MPSAAPSKLRNTLPPLASNDLLCAAEGNVADLRGEDRFRTVIVRRSRNLRREFNQRHRHGLTRKHSPKEIGKEGGERWGPMTCGSFLPVVVFLEAFIQVVALVVNAIAEAIAVLRTSMIAASVRALEFRIARPDVVHKSVDDDHCGDDCDNASKKYPGKLSGHLLIWCRPDVAR